jgi:hypothetical protein
MTCARLADELNISPSGVSKAVERGREMVHERSIEERILKSHSGRRRRLLSPAPHRSGRAQFAHPAPHIMVSLQDDKPSV